MPQGAILSPLFFSIYTNDIVNGADADFNLFADETSVYVTAKSIEVLQQKLQNVLDKLCSWFKPWAISVNHSKSAALVLSKKRNLPP